MCQLDEAHFGRSRVDQRGVLFKRAQVAFVVDQETMGESQRRLLLVRALGTRSCPPMRDSARGGNTATAVRRHQRLQPAFGGAVRRTRPNANRRRGARLPHRSGSSSRSSSGICYGFNLSHYGARSDRPIEGARSYEPRVHHGTLLKRAQAASVVGQEMGGIPTSWAPSNRTNSEPSLASPRSHAMPPVPQFSPT